MGFGADLHRTLRVFAATSACVLLGCSAGGPGGPTSPPAIASQDGGAVVDLRGRVVDQETGTALAGVRVAAGGATAWTDADGSFSLAVAPGARMNFSGAGYYDRTTTAEAGRTWAMVPRSFDMTAFNDVARDHSPGTLRWVSAPDVYIDTRAHAFPAGTSVPDAWIAQVAELAPAFVASWTGGAIRVGTVTVGATPPAAGTPGTIVISFDEDPGRYPTVTAAGSAIASWDARGVIESARVRLRFSGLSGGAAAFARQAVIGHELGHALGLAHMDGGVASMMAAVIRTPELTAFDRAAGALLYDRRPGNLADDRDADVDVRGLGALARL